MVTKNGRDVLSMSISRGKRSLEIYAGESEDLQLRQPDAFI